MRLIVGAGGTIDTGGVVVIFLSVNAAAMSGKTQLSILNKELQGTDMKIKKKNKQTEEILLTCHIDQALGSLFHPLLIEEMYILLTFPSRAMSFSHTG